MYTCKLQGFCLPNKENRKRHTCIYVPSEFFCVDYFNKCEFSEYRKYPTVRSAPYGSQSESIKRGTSLRTFLIAYEKNEDLAYGYSQSASLLAHAKNLCKA